MGGENDLMKSPDEEAFAFEDATIFPNYENIIYHAEAATTFFVTTSL